MVTPPDLPLLPAVDLPIWRQQIRADFFPLWLEPRMPGPFRAHAVVKTRPDCRLAHVRCSSHKATLALGDCKDLNSRWGKLLWLIEGRAHLEQGARSIDIEAGHWVVTEADRPYEMEFDEGATFAVMVCASDDSGAWRNLASRIGSHALPTHDASRLALGSVLAAAAADVALESDSCSVLRYSVRHYLEIAAGRADETPRQNHPSTRHLLAAAQSFVLSHLPRPDLRPDTIAAAISISRRTLYKAFAEAGESPQAYVQRMRLLRAKEWLGDPRHSHRSLTDLAMALGFNDAAYFSRAFRRQFGRTPSALRHAART